MFGNDYEPIERCLLAIDNRWKRARNDKFVFDHYGHTKKQKKEPFSGFLGTANTLSFSEEITLILVLCIYPCLCKCCQ